MKRRTVLVGVAAALGGCTSVDWPDVDPPGDDRPLVSASPGDYPHVVRADNSLDRAVSITLTVREGDSTMYEGRHEVGAENAGVLVGFTRETFPPERQYVTVTATTDDGGTASVGVSITACLGNVVVTFTDDGEPSITYSIC